MYVSSVRLRYRYIVMVVQLASINANLSGSRFGPSNTSYKREKIISILPGIWNNVVRDLKTISSLIM